MSESIAIEEHPSFTKARSLPEPWRTHFPKSHEEFDAFKAHVARFAMSSHVLVVANTRVECAWCAYCDAVEGRFPAIEEGAVLLHGNKLGESMARILFPQFEGIPYAH